MPKYVLNGPFRTVLFISTLGSRGSLVFWGLQLACILQGCIRTQGLPESSRRGLSIDLKTLQTGFHVRGAYQAECFFGPWVFLCANFAAVLGLFLGLQEYPFPIIC